MLILLKRIDKFNVIPVEIQARFLVEVNKFTLEFIQKGKRPRISKKIWGKKKLKDAY